MNEGKLMMELCGFNSLVDKYQQRFIRFADSYVHDRMLAEDIVMDSFMYYWENRRGLASDVNIPAYVLTAVKHRCIDKLREKKHSCEVSGDLNDISVWKFSFQIDALENFEPHDVFTSEIEQLVEKTLNGLPEQTRRIFILSRYENKSYKEISEMYGISVKGVEFHISKTIKMLRASLKDYLPSVIIFF